MLRPRRETARAHGDKRHDVAQAVALAKRDSAFSTTNVGPGYRP
jgi:hypothetical protein